MSKNIDLSTLADGAVAERLNIEMQKVLDNVTDPNTDAVKARKITLTLTVKPNENRKSADIKVSAKTTLAPAKEVASLFIIDTDSAGKVTGAELKSGIPGQTYIDPDGDIATDVGEKVNDLEKKREKKALGFK